MTNCCGYGLMYDGAQHTDDCETPTLPHEALAAWDTATIEIVDRTPALIISPELAAIDAEDAASLQEAWGAIREELYAALAERDILTDYATGGYISESEPVTVPVYLSPGDKIIRPDGTVIDPFASKGTATGGYISGRGSANNDTIPVSLSRGCAYIYRGRGHISQETLDALNATSTVVFSYDEEDC